MNRPTLRDVERVAPSNYGPGGGYVITACDGTCPHAGPHGVPVFQHRYAYGYTKKTALQSWRENHPRQNGDTKNV